MADLSDMFGQMNAALGNATPVPSPVPISAPPADDASDARPLTIRPDPAPSSSVQDTIAALAAALPNAKQPAAAKAVADTAPASVAPPPATLSTPIAGSAGMLPQGFSQQAAAMPGAPRSAPQQSASQTATDTNFDPEGTGQANYDTGPGDGLTPGQRLANLPGIAVNMAAQAAQGAPIIGAGVNKAAAALASLANGRSYADNLATGDQVSSDFQAAHPVAATVARIGGAIGTMAPLMEAAPVAMGLEGPMALRVAAGAGSNAALSGADSAVRGEDPEDIAKAAAIGAVGGAAAPIVEGSAKALVGAYNKTVAPAVAGFTAPSTYEAQIAKGGYIADQAKAKLLAASSDPATLPARVAATADQPTLVPNSPSTTAAAVGGDSGLYHAEKAAREIEPAPFKAIDKAQSDATLAAIQNVQSTGDVFAPGQMIRSRLDAIDQQAQDAQDALNAKVAQNATNRQTAQTQLAATQADQSQAALAQAQSAARDLGPAADPNALGADFRAAQMQAKSTAKYGAGGTYDAPTGGTKALANAVDPNGTLTVSTAPTKDALQSIIGDIDPYTGTQPQGKEADLHNLINNLPDEIPFRSMQTLDQRTGAAMKAAAKQAQTDPANFDPLSVPRLTQLKSAIKDNIANAGQAQADHEAGLVSQGLLHPDDTMASRLTEQFGVPDPANGQSATGSAGAADAVPGSTASPSARSGGAVDAPQGRLGSASSGQGDAAQAGSQGGRSPGQIDGGVRVQTDANGQSFQTSDPDLGDTIVRSGGRGNSVTRIFRQANGTESRGVLNKNGDMVSANDIRLNEDNVNPETTPWHGPSDVGQTLAEIHAHTADIANLGKVSDLDNLTRDLAQGKLTNQQASESLSEILARRNNSGLGQDRFTAPLYDPDAPVRAPQSPGVPRPQDINTFVRRAGGIQDDGGDLASMGLHNLIAKPGQGLSADAMREAAAQAGYLGPDIDHAMATTTPDDLLNAVSSDRPVHSVHDEAAVEAWSRYDQAKADYARAQSESEGRSTGATSLPPKAPLSSYSQDDIYAPGTAPSPANGPLNLTPNRDPEVAARLAAFNKAHGELKQTFDNPTVKGSFATNGYSGQFEMPAAGILARAFHPGPVGGADLDAYLKSAGNDPRAVNAVAETALNTLRPKANPAGVFQQKDVNAWIENNRPALARLEQANPGFLDRVKTAGAAQKSLADLDVANRQAMDAHNTAAAAQALADKNELKVGVAQAKSVVKAANATPAGKFANAVGNAISPDEVGNTVFNMLKTGTSGASRMRSVVQSVQSDPAALAGLRRGGIEGMARHFVNSDGTLAVAKSISFLKDNMDTLRELYPSEQVSNFGAVVRKLDADQAINKATSVVGSPTSKNQIARIKELGGKIAGHVSDKGGHATSMLFAGYELLSQTLEHGTLHGAVAGLSTLGTGYLLNTLRDAGINKASDLFRAVLADPQLARSLMATMPDTANAGRLHAVAAILRRSMVAAPVVARAGAQQ